MSSAKVPGVDSLGPSHITSQLVVGTTGLDRLLNTTTVGNLNVPIQEVQEQPNGQFQITENGALNLMKADSMDILVVNNLAQDLSVGREQNVLDKAELTDATLLGDSLSSYQTQEAQQELLSAESSSFIENHSLQSTDSSFLSSLLQTNTDSIGCIDIGNSLMFNTTPEVEVLTSLLEVDDDSDLTHRESSEIFPDIPATETTSNVKPTESAASVECQWKGCNSKHVNQDDLINHVNVSHIKCEKDEEYICQWEDCPRKGKGFSARYKILIHIRTHTNEKPHACELCNKSFARIENLKIHARTHSGEKPYTCPIPNCNKAYANSSDRFKHVRTHKEDKPYACKMTGCGKRYTDPSSLRKHIRNHGHKVGDKKTSRRLLSNTAEAESSTGNGNILDSARIESSPKVLVIHNSDSQQTTEQLTLADSSCLQIANLISNPLLSSSVGTASMVFPPVSPDKSVWTETRKPKKLSGDISGPDSSGPAPIVFQPVSPDLNVSSDSHGQKQQPDLHPSESDIPTSKECVNSEQTNSTQDYPLDLSTYTGISTGNRLVATQSVGVKLPSVSCFVGK